MSSHRRRVIVIGGGMSGRVMANRLRDAGGGIDVTVLTRSAGQAGSGTADLCLSLAERPAAVQAVLADGRTIYADAAVLATGCASFSTHVDDGFGSARLLPEEQGIAPDQPVAVIGSTASAVRYALAALSPRRSGVIHMISPGGWLPPVHGGKALELERADIPLGTGLRYLLRWFRETAAWAHPQGFDIGAVIDGLKPHVPAIWQHLTPADRRRFVVHLRRFWSVAESTLSAAEDEALKAAIASGQLNLVHGRFAGGERVGDRFRFRVTRLDGLTPLTFDAALFLNFDDAPPGPESFTSPVVSGLIAQGLARPDPLQFGLDVSDACALLDAQGRASRRLFALGAPTRGHFVDALDIGRIRK